VQVELGEHEATGDGWLAKPERYVGRIELAAIMGVSVTTVDRLVRAGMPSETWGLRARRFRPSRAVAWARERTER
jgi:phage terminase Nu1 subunit (DNA packaging protein)